MQGNEQKVKNMLASIKGDLDKFLENSGFRPEQVLHGKTYEQFMREQEAKLRKFYKC